VVTDETLTAYGAHARAYRDDNRELPNHIRAELDTFAGAVGAGRRVLEIGSGGGRDAVYLESLGLQVRRTDVTPAFVDLLREDGFTADVLDPLRDDLTDPVWPHELYDAVWANACLLHVRRAHLPTVLERLRRATRPGGLLRFSVKEGNGEQWLNRGPVTEPRLFIYWKKADLCAVVDQAGWSTTRIRRTRGLGEEHWLEVWATNGSVQTSA
jgi:SAM-dependent methyltransferase